MLRQIVYIFFFLCWSIASKSQLSAAKIDSIINTLPSIKNDSIKVETFNKIAFHYLRSENPEKCLEYLQQAIPLGKQCKHHIETGRAYNLKGNMYNLYGDLSQMLQDFLMAEEYFRKANHKTGISEVLINISGVFFESGKDSLALKYMKEARSIIEELNDSNRLGIVLAAEGLIYDKQRDSEKAIASFNNAEAIFKASNNGMHLANLYLSMGDSYTHAQQYGLTKTYYQKSKDLAVRLRNNRFLVQALKGILTAHLQLNELDSAKIVVEELPPLLTQINELQLIKESYGTISQYYLANKDYINVLKYNELQQQFTDSLHLKEKQKQKDWINTIAKLKEKENEAKSFLIQQKQKDAVISQQRITVYIVLLSMLIIAILLYFQIRANIKLRSVNKLSEKQQQEITVRKQELEKTNAAKDQLFSIISHDLMSPVIALSSILELLKMGEINQEELPDFIDEAMVEVGNTTAFLRNLLLWAKSQMDGFIVKKEPIDFYNSVQSNIDLLQPQINKKDIALLNLIAPNTQVSADIELLNTVLRNLISNAVKFTDRGGRIEISAIEQANFIQVAIKDSGVGIPKDIQNKILSDALYSTRGTQNEKGTGIGLSLCKSFIEKNGGTIWFESAGEEGATFYFTVEKVE